MGSGANYTSFDTVQVGNIKRSVCSIGVLQTVILSSFLGEKAALSCGDPEGSTPLGQIIAHFKNICHLYPVTCICPVLADLRSSPHLVKRQFPKVKF